MYKDLSGKSPKLPPTNLTRRQIGIIGNTIIIMVWATIKTATATATGAIVQLILKSRVDARILNGKHTVKVILLQGACIILPHILQKMCLHQPCTDIKSLKAKLRVSVLVSPTSTQNREMP